jgi:hypothetical protein
MIFRKGGFLIFYLKKIIYRDIKYKSRFKCLLINVFILEKKQHNKK